jgi:hypothetical protein
MAKGNGQNGGGTATAKREVTLYPSRRKIEIAPGVKVLQQLPREHVPEVALIKWQAIGDGTYRPILKTYELDIRVTDAMRVLHVHYQTLLRLCRGGFVDHVQVSPNNVMMSLSSYFDHIEKVRRDPEFWSKEKNRRAYRNAL